MMNHYPYIAWKVRCAKALAMFRFDLPQHAVRKAAKGPPTMNRICDGILASPLAFFRI